MKMHTGNRQKKYISENGLVVIACPNCMKWQTSLAFAHFLNNGFKKYSSF
jgi:hypothetical protein